MKKRISVTLDPTIKDSWEQYCEDNFINASKLIGYLIMTHLKEKGAL